VSCIVISLWSAVFQFSTILLPSAFAKLSGWI